MFEYRNPQGIGLDLVAGLQARDLRMKQTIVLVSIWLWSLCEDRQANMVVWYCDILCCGHGSAMDVQDVANI